MSCVMNGTMKEFKVTGQGKISLIEADLQGQSPFDVDSAAIAVVKEMISRL